MKSDAEHSVPATAAASRAECLQRIAAAPACPTVYPTSPENLRAYARTLAEEGYPAMEILCRPIDRALDTFAAIGHCEERRLISWGIGTVITEAAAVRAVELAPDFIVSPAFSRRVLRVAADAVVPYIPGVRTFQDVQNVIDAFEEHGLIATLLKLCPIDGLDASYVGMLRGCYPDITFCPTGTTTDAIYAYWKAVPGIGAMMSSAFVPREHIESQNQVAIRARLRHLRDLGQAAARVLPVP